ncbi:MAG: glycosyltransferase family A protein [Thermodesulfobacteriota bacterium]
MHASVIIPVYNGAATLPRTVQSFLDQEVEPGQHYELVLCDDGSTDASAEILAAYAHHPQVTVLRQENLGQSAASNRAAQQAQGELLLFAAQDIVPQDRHFIQNHLAGHAAGQRERCLTGYIRYPDELITSDFMEFMRDGHHQFDYFNIADPDDLDPMKLYAPNFSVKKSWFFQVGGFDERFRYGFQDSDLGLRFFSAGLKLSLAANINCWHYHPLTLREYASKKRSFGRLFWDLFARHRHFFENICEPRLTVEIMLKNALTFLLNRDLFSRILQEIDYFQERSVEPIEDLYNEFSIKIMSLPPLSEDMPKSKAYWCKYTYYSAYLTFCYYLGLAERAMELGLLKKDAVDVSPLVLEEK